MKTTRRFEQWWSRMLALEKDRRSLEFERWLHYAGKTAALRGDQNQQRVIYTIHNRFKNSTYKRITKANAWRVYSIVNQQQALYRKQKLEQTQTERKPTVVVHKRIHKRIIRSGADYGNRSNRDI